MFIVRILCLSRQFPLPLLAPPLPCMLAVTNAHKGRSVSIRILFCFRTHISKHLQAPGPGSSQPQGPTSRQETQFRYECRAHSRVPEVKGRPLHRQTGSQCDGDRSASQMSTQNYESTSRTHGSAPAHRHARQADDEQYAIRDYHIVTCLLGIDQGLRKSDEQAFVAGSFV
jgi:hypothetical protein